LGGHIDEASIVLKQYSVEGLQDRIDKLQLSMDQLGGSDGLKSLFNFIKYKDDEIAQRTYEFFTPGITFDKEGVLFFLIGALCGYVLYEILTDTTYFVYKKVVSFSKRKRSIPVMDSPAENREM